ncbi:MAG: hypothetical protein U9P42_10930 [Candidatus Fermentibacteria bacterium]|nr:hypothetical protein [Candidatus Fermentibacteria bacterium]
MRTLEGLLIVVGASLWGLAFYFGPGADSWILGKWGMFLIVVSGILRVVEFLIPNRKPQPKRSKGPVRKCPVCGKPAISGSRYCSYHTKYGPEDGPR